MALIARITRSFHRLTLEDHPSLGKILPSATLQPTTPGNGNLHTPGQNLLVNIY